MDGVVGVPAMVEAPPGDSFTVGGELLSGNLGRSVFVSVFADRRYARDDHEIQDRRRRRRRLIASRATCSSRATT